MQIPEAYGWAEEAVVYAYCVGGTMVSWTSTNDALSATQHAVLLHGGIRRRKS